MRYLIKSWDLIGSNYIIDINHIKDMTKLESLFLSNNSIINIEVLERMNPLINGHFSNNKITDLTPVKITIYYSYFDFSNNNIIDISPLVINSNDYGYYGPGIDLLDNYLDIREGSQNMKDIQSLIRKGYNIYYEWQKDPIAVNEIILNKSQIELEVGVEDNLSVTILPFDATNQKVTWTSSDESIIKVNVNGKVNAISPGNATIKVTTVDGAKTASCEVIVVKAYDIWKDILTTELDDHTWTVKLNMPVNESTVDDSSVYIIDENNNKLSFINASVGNDEKFGYIKLNNDGRFEKNKRYWIIIEDTIKSFNDIPLKKGLKIEFKVE